jgi:hypothetical protein
LRLLLGDACSTAIPQNQLSRNTLKPRLCIGSGCAAEAALFKT